MYDVIFEYLQSYFNIKQSQKNNAIMKFLEENPEFLLETDFHSLKTKSSKVHLNKNK